MRSHKHPIILFIDRFGFSLFQDTLPNIPKFNFTPDVVANLDVVNKGQFINLIATFIQINKIVPSALVIILSDTIIYIKDLTKPQSNPQEEQKDEVQNFLENIPFEEVLAKVIKTDEGGRIVAVNKDLVMTIADAFVNKGSIIEAIIPSFLYGPNVNFTLGLTQDNIQAILGGSEIFKVGNLLTDQQKVISLEDAEGEENQPAGTKSDLADGEKKPQNLSLYLLVGVFVTLLVILVVVYFNLGASQTPPPARKMKSSSVEKIITPTSPTLVQLPITTALLDIKNIKVKIVQNSQSDTVVSNLKSELLKIGFQDIASEVSQASIPEKSSVIFSQNIPSDVRNIAVTEIKKILPDVSISENQDANLAITILIGKS